MREDLMRKGHKYVARYMWARGYELVHNYDTEEGCHVGEYSKCHAGVTLKSAIITFSQKWRVVDVESRNF